MVSQLRRAKAAFKSQQGLNRAELLYEACSVSRTESDWSLRPRHTLIGYEENCCSRSLIKIQSHHSVRRWSESTAIRDCEVLPKLKKIASATQEDSLFIQMWKCCISHEYFWVINTVNVTFPNLNFFSKTTRCTFKSQCSDGHGSAVSVVTHCLYTNEKHNYE